MEYWETVLVNWLVVHFLIEYTVYPAKTDKLYSQKKLLWIHGVIYGVAMFVMMWYSIGVFGLGDFWRLLLSGKLGMEEMWGIWWLWWIILMVARTVFVCCRHHLDGKNLKAIRMNWIVLLQNTSVVVLLMAGCHGAFVFGRYRYGVWLGDTQVTLVALVLLMFIMVWDVASCFVKRVFSLVPLVSNESAQDQYALFAANRNGELIGKLERVVIVLLILFEQFAGIGFVLTAKSLARFKMFEDREFAERYLIGTLSSFIYAIVVGLIGRCLLQKMNVAYF